MLDFGSSEVYEPAEFDTGRFQDLEQLCFISPIVLRIDLQLDRTSNAAPMIFSDTFSTQQRVGLRPVRFQHALIRVSYVLIRGKNFLGPSEAKPRHPNERINREKNQLAEPA